MIAARLHGGGALAAASCARRSAAAAVVVTALPAPVLQPRRAFASRSRSSSCSTSTLPGSSCMMAAGDAPPQQAHAVHESPHTDASSCQAGAQGDEHQLQQQQQQQQQQQHQQQNEQQQQQQQQQNEQQQHQDEQQQQHKSSSSHHARWPRPTHFLSLRVSHEPAVVARIAALQAGLIARAPELQPALLEPMTAHLTVTVLHLPTQQHEQAAQAALASLPAALQRQGLLGALQLQLGGLSTFRGQVLYLDVVPGPAAEQLQRVGDAIAAHFHSWPQQQQQLVCEEPGRGFTPHVTIAKLSRMRGAGGRGHGKRGRGKQGRVPKIPPAAWQGLEEALHEPGQQQQPCVVSIDELHICSMQGRLAGQYYQVARAVSLAAPPGAAAPGAGAAGAAAAAASVAPPWRAAARARFKRLLQALVCGGGPPPQSNPKVRRLQ